MLDKIVFSLPWLLLLCPLMLTAQGNSEIDISDYRWQNRLLLIFTSSVENEQYQKQVTELKNKQEGLKDRDMKIFHLVSNDRSFVDDKTINTNDVRRLYKKYKVKEKGFAVILIGKDGTEKLRKQDALSTEKIFSVIDAMPMRQQEMKQDGK
jgi:predicted transcriptional regulator